MPTNNTGEGGEGGVTHIVIDQMPGSGAAQPMFKNRAALIGYIAMQMFANINFDLNSNTWSITNGCLGKASEFADHASGYLKDLCAEW